LTGYNVVVLDQRGARIRGVVSQYGNEEVVYIQRLPGGVADIEVAVPLPALLNAR
jgi:hypothetical protein